MFDHGQPESKTIDVCNPGDQPSIHSREQPGQDRETATAASRSNWAWSHGHGHFDWMDSYAPFVDVNHNDSVL